MAWRSGDQEVERRSAQNRVIEGDYFDALGIRLLQGRTFHASDRLDAPPVAIISKSAAEVALPGQDPVGREIGAAGQWRTVVGIVSDVAVDHRGTVQPTVYLPHTEFGHNRNWALIQVLATNGPPADLWGAVRRELARIDSDLVVYHPRSMTAIMRRQVAQDRFALTLMGIFAAVAIALAAVGIYGVLSYSVSQRSREIGIRLALGARAEQVRRIVAGQGALIAAVGIAVGTVAAFGLSRLLESMVFGVSVRDPLIFATVRVVLAIVAFLAGHLPARRATQVDPVESLRRE